MESLKDCVAIIAGAAASRDLGREHALHFVELGEKVVDESNALGGEAKANQGSVLDWDTGTEMIDLGPPRLGLI